MPKNADGLPDEPLRHLLADRGTADSGASWIEWATDHDGGRYVGPLDLPSGATVHICAVDKAGHSESPYRTVVLP